MPADVSYISLRDANVELIDCDHRTPPTSDSGYPYVAIPQLRDGRIQLSEARRIKPEHYVAWIKKAKPEAHDVVLSRRCNPGETAVVESGMEFALGQNLVLLRADGTKVYPPYLRWLVRSPEWWEQVWKFINVGAVFDSLKCADIPNFQLPIPALSDQRAIHHILGSLDDKIALNRRMNETLEAMARAIFKSWFVDFDPVCAKAEGRLPFGVDTATAALFPNSFQDSPLGKIPRGWNATQLGDVVEIHDSKRVPLSGRERAQRRGTYPYYGAASVMDYVDDYLFDGVYALLGEDGSVVNDDNTPVVQYVWGKFWVNNHAHVLSGRGHISTEHLVLYLRQVNIRPFVTGAVQPKLNQQNLRRVPFIDPPLGTCKKFCQIIEPIYSLMRANTEQSATLTSIRDALLPKLISGEIRVKGATNFVEELAH